MSSPILARAVPLPATTLPATTPSALSLQALLLVAASFLLPAAAHALELPVRALLPMHWPVLLAGLVYGWRSGALVGLTAPSLAHLLSGMPRLEILPAMTVELALYGLLAGLLRERLRWNRFAAVAVAIAVGRLTFLTVAVATGATGPSLPAYLQAALLPGLVAALAQIALLPLLAARWPGRGLQSDPQTSR
jgi:niacin transporter